MATVKVRNVMGVDFPFWKNRGVHAHEMSTNPIFVDSTNSITSL